MRRFLILLPISTVALADEPKWTLNVESGSAWSNRNVTRIPGDTGTQFPLTNLTGRGPFQFQRWELQYQQAANTEWRLLYAPLSFSGTGNLSQTTSFQGVTFDAGPTQGYYQFNSYRLTYRKKWKASEKSNWMFGYTLKVRDAEISLRQGETQASEKDPRGVVPLLHLSGRELLGPQWFANFDIDGLAGGPGRAFDLGAQLHYRINDTNSAYLGLRTLEGGADTPKVYSFAWINYVSLGISHRF